MGGVRGKSCLEKAVLFLSAFAALLAVRVAEAASPFGPPASDPTFLGSQPVNPQTPYGGITGQFNSIVDSYPDTAIVNFDDDLLLIYLGDPLGVQHLTHTYGIFNFVHPRAVAAADLNNDGKVDLVVGDETGISVLLGDGHGNFAAASPQRPGFPGNLIDGVTKIFLSDINHDGRIDIVSIHDDAGTLVITANTHMTVSLGTGGGKFGAPTSYKLGSFWGQDFAVVFADFDNDGQPDIMFDDDDHVRFMKGAANGTFADPVSALDKSSNPAAETAVGAVDADVDGDLEPDFVFVQFGGNLFWAKSNGNGTLQAPTLIASGVTTPANAFPYHVVAADFTGDGRVDLALAGLVFIQQPAHNFSVFSAGFNSDTSALAFADFNLDSRNDLVTTGADPFHIAFFLTSSGPADHVLITGGNNQSTVFSTPFPSPLSIKVLDAGNVGVSGAQVTFSPPTGFGASAVMTTGITATSPTGDASDTATANNTIGCYSINVTVQGILPVTPFLMCNTNSDSMTATGGTPQSALVSTAFATPLEVTVLDGTNSPKQGVSVTFSAPPPNGGFASATSFPQTVSTDINGKAHVNATANGTAGSYFVTASATGLAPVSFSLGNSAVALNAAQIVLDGLTSPQSALIGTSYTFPLKVKVTDGSSNPVAGAVVTYTAVPNSVTGASTSVLPATATTDVNGFAQVSATANLRVGSFVVSVGIQNNNSVPPATISLRNFAPLPHAIAIVSGTPQSTPITTLFGQTLRVHLTDTQGNPTPQVGVFFIAPAGGATAFLSGQTVVTDDNGNAEVSATANGTPGSYPVGAVVFQTQLEHPIFVSFSLTNTAGATAAPIPAASPLGLLVLAAVLAGAGWFLLNRLS